MLTERSILKGILKGQALSARPRRPTGSAFPGSGVMGPRAMTLERYRRVSAPASRQDRGGVGGQAPILRCENIGTAGDSNGKQASPFCAPWNTPNSGDRCDDLRRRIGVNSFMPAVRCDSGIL